MTTSETFVWSVLLQNDDRRNEDLTGFAFEHSLSSSHPPREGNNLKIKVFIKLLGSLGHTLGGLPHPFDCKASPLQTCFSGSFLICSGSLLSSRSPKITPAIHQQPEALKPSRAARCFQGLITHFQLETPSILQTNTSCGNPMEVGSLKPE